MAVPIKDIKRYTFYPLIRARVCRVWIAKFQKQVSSFNCLFIDNQVIFSKTYISLIYLYREWKIININIFFSFFLQVQ